MSRERYYAVDEWSWITSTLLRSLFFCLYKLVHKLVTLPRFVGDLSNIISKCYLLLCTVDLSTMKTKLSYIRSYSYFVNLLNAYRNSELSRWSNKIINQSLALAGTSNNNKIAQELITQYYCSHKPRLISVRVTTIKCGLTPRPRHLGQFRRCGRELWLSLESVWCWGGANDNLSSATLWLQSTQVSFGELGRWNVLHGRLVPEQVSPIRW